MREAISLMKEAISLMRDAISLLEERRTERRGECFRDLGGMRLGAREIERRLAREDARARGQQRVGVRGE
jgi:hypothetical protein